MRCKNWTVDNSASMLPWILISDFFLMWIIASEQRTRNQNNKWYQAVGCWLSGEKRQDVTWAVVMLSLTSRPNGSIVDQHRTQRPAAGLRCSGGASPADRLCRFDHAAADWPVSVENRRRWFVSLLRLFPVTKRMCLARRQDGQWSHWGTCRRLGRLPACQSFQSVLQRAFTDKGKAFFSPVLQRGWAGPVSQEPERECGFNLALCVLLKMTRVFTQLCPQYDDVQIQESALVVCHR